MVKPARETPIDRTTMDATTHFLSELLKLMHPFMPFITEEIWSHLSNEQHPYLINALWPEMSKADEQLLVRFEQTKDWVMKIRNYRASNQMSPKEVVPLSYKAVSDVNVMEGATIKLANLSDLQRADVQPAQSLVVMAGTTELYLPLPANGDQEGNLDKLKEELEYTRGFLNTVEKKLGNARFVDNAPEQVVEAERKKKSDAEARIRSLETQLAAVSGK